MLSEERLSRFSCWDGDREALEMEEMPEEGRPEAPMLLNGGLGGVSGSSALCSLGVDGALPPRKELRLRLPELGMNGVDASAISCFSLGTWWDVSRRCCRSEDGG